MTTLALATLLFSYTLGGVWEIGPFTDRASCESARRFQLTWGITDVTECRVVNPWAAVTIESKGDDLLGE